MPQPAADSSDEEGEDGPTEAAEIDDAEILEDLPDDAEVCAPVLDNECACRALEANGQR